MALFVLSALVVTREEAAIMAHQEDMPNWNYLLVATSHTLVRLETGCLAFVTMVSFGFGVMKVKSKNTSTMKAMEKISSTVHRNLANQFPSDGSTNKRVSKS